MSATADDQKSAEVAATVAALRKVGKHQLSAKEKALIERLVSTGNRAALGSEVRGVDERVKLFMASVREAFALTDEPFGEDDERAAMETLASDWNVTGQLAAEALIHRRTARGSVQAAVPKASPAPVDQPQNGQAKSSPHG